jgi:G3E family GTPase
MSTREQEGQTRSGMHLLLFSGFLGSGKTSLLIPVAKLAVQSGRRVAIIVNEIGDIGIDNQLMGHLGLNVWELVAGCICCTLSGDLVNTLEKLDEGYSPDLVMIEASGAADPHAVLTMLPHYHGRPLLSARTVSVLDPLRLPILMEVMTPLITSQIAHADVVVISKTDVATGQELENARATARHINPAAHVAFYAKEEHMKEELISVLLP